MNEQNAQAQKKLYNKGLCHQNLQLQHQGLIQKEKVHIDYKQDVQISILVNKIATQ